MRNAILTVTLAMLAGVLGCEASGPRGGGSARDEGFQIVVPALDTVIKQGETQTVTVSLRRGDYFKRDVRLEFKTTAGVKLDPSSVLIKASDTPDAKVRITAAKDAALGEYRIYVKGDPVDGEDTSAEFRVRVEKP